jgi:tetratricopeptide (TPR) repeat protein
MGVEDHGSVGTVDAATDGLASMARTTPERRGVPDWPEPPFPVGRYLVTAPIGRGATGVVYRGHDPELDRSVAIKLVFPRARSDRVRERLLGEAQAIARLSHPNVVAVHDVGTVVLPQEDRPAAMGVYMVLELVEGVTMRKWMRDRTRRWTELLDVLLAAGRGLEAAHRAGLVHRDFKPDNVLIGDEGRVRVLDFGLATSAHSTSSGEDEHGRRPESVEIAGTPAYMAPEQHDGSPTDARTDLFAFCVTCWEALGGVQPFEGRTLDELACSKAAGPPAMPRTRAPRWLFDVIRPGLAVDPHARPRSMTALLGELERRRKRRRTLVVAAVGSTAVAAVLGVGFALGGDARACIADGENRLSAVWNDETRAAGRATFEAADLPYAADAWTRVETVLDGRASTWRDTRAQACEAAVGSGADPIDHAAAALLCLDRHLDDLAARVDLMRLVDRETLRHAAAAAERMPSPDRCLDAAFVAREPQGLAASIDAELLRARVQHDMGHYDEAIAAARVAADDAERAGDPLRHARALYQGCRSRSAGRREREVEDACSDAWVAAERAGADGLAISAMNELLGEATLEQKAEADRLARLIEARIDGLPPDGRDWSLEYSFALTMAQRMREAGEFRAARVQAQRAIDTVVEAIGPDDSRIVSPTNELALVAEALGELEVAREHFGRAVEMLHASRGPSHPDVVSLENNLAGLDITLGRFEPALVRLEKVLAAKEALEGKRSAWLMTTLYQLVEALCSVGRGDDALVHGQRALAIAEAQYGRESTELVSPLVSLANALRVADRCADAMQMLARADAITRATGTRDVELAAKAELQRGLCEEQLGRTHEAGASLARAVALHEEFHGPSSRNVVQALLAHARWERAHGTENRARELLVRADEICRATEGDPALAGRVADELAALVGNR